MDRVRHSRSDPDDRKLLCEQIFNHPYFINRNEMWFDPNRKDFLADIVKKHSNISRTLFTKLKKPRKYCPWFCHENCAEIPESMSRRINMWERVYEDKPEEFKKCFSWCRYKPTEYHYTNGPKDRAVLVDEERYSESMFMCPVLKAGNIVVYFVSDNDYDVNEADPGDEIIEFIPGRFIFSFDDEKLNVIALAEDIAFVTVPMSLIEMFFLRRDVNQTPARLSKEDPVCVLKDPEKLRLCSIILNSEALKNQIKFLLEQDSVVYECRKITISFRDENPSTINPNILEQWMIGCNARPVDGTRNRMYHISRGYRANTAYLYTSEDDDVYLYQFYSNVSLLSR